MNARDLVVGQVSCFAGRQFKCRSAVFGDDPSERPSLFALTFFLPSLYSTRIFESLLDFIATTTMAAVHEERFIPPRHKMDQLSIVKGYATVPRLEYRYVFVV